MKRIIFALFPLIVLLLALKPVTVVTIHGKVVDAKGNAVIASIVVKGSPDGTVSGKDGEFSIKVSDANAVLVVSAVGFKTKEFPLNGKNNIVISLEIDKVVNEQIIIQQMQKDEEGKRRKGVALESKVPGLSSYPTNSGYYDDSQTQFEREGYDYINENRFQSVNDHPLSTFSIDVDGASYSNVRRFLRMGQLPPAGAVRVEEMINYFKYDYEGPKNNDPFAIHTEISECPWNPAHKLVLIGLQGRELPVADLPASNMVFLIDVSGSMNDPMKLPLVKRSLKMLVDQLREQDRVALVVYAGAAGLVLPSTSAANKQTIKDAIDRLDAGGSTAGGAGIKLAYKVARENFAEGGNNRVILCTDGDFNVGASSDDAMERLIEEERKSGVFLTVLGFGTGNYQDAKMQKLSNKGNGNHAYIDGISEARKVLVNEFGGTMFTIAKDVKLQVEFNPAKVQGYRLIGYENRMLKKEDFNNDRKDAGELGSGHTVTALYEVIPAGINTSLLGSVDPLKYQQKNGTAVNSSSNEILTVKFRYKKPDGDISSLITKAVKDSGTDISETSNNFRFAAAVAQFGMLLRNSEFVGGASYLNVLELAKGAVGRDDEGYREEFIRMVRDANSVASTNRNNSRNVADANK